MCIIVIYEINHLKVVKTMLEFEEYKVKLNNAKPGLEDLRGALKLESAQKEIEELEAASEREGFWNDVEKSQKVQKRLKTLKNKVENFQKLCAAWDDMYTICEMAIEENDDSMLEELESEYKQFSEKVEETRLSTLSAPAVVIRFATSFAEMGSRLLAFLS